VIRHRVQVALMTRQLAAEPLATDFAMFLMEGRREVHARLLNDDLIR
jgi:hypothetical protein